MIHYANDVRAATKLTKPERGVAALMRIAHGQAVYLNGMRDWIDDDWAHFKRGDRSSLPRRFLGIRSTHSRMRRKRAARTH